MNDPDKERLISYYDRGLHIGKLVIGAHTWIGGTVNPLFRRWILWRLPAIGNYLHKYLRSDFDKALHDHPWPFIAIILKGGYYEVHDQTQDRTEETLWHGPGSVLVRPAQWRHRVVLPTGDNGKPKTSWSFIIVGRREQKWGFYLPTGWCWWRKHNPVKNICEDHILWPGGKD